MILCPWIVNASVPAELLQTDLADIRYACLSFTEAAVEDCAADASCPSGLNRAVAHSR